MATNIIRTTTIALVSSPSVLLPNPPSLLSLALIIHPARAEENTPQTDLAQIKGQEHAKHALEVAAAGGHNIMIFETPFASFHLPNP